MSSTSILFTIQQNIGRYGLSTLLILGNFGNLFTILILGRSLKQKMNSCSLYLFSASISNWIVINTGLVSNIIGIDHTDPQHTSNIICKLRWSGVHALLMLSRSFMVAACIDRWAVCSQNLTIRTFSRPYIARRIIIILLIVWTIIPIHVVIFFNNSTGRCIPLPGIYTLFYAIYSLIIIGIVPLLLMIVFSFRAWQNLQLTHTRVLPTGYNIRNIQIRKRDRDLLKMLTGEVFIYFLTTVPYPINQIYNVSTSSITAYKSSIRIEIESLIGYIVSPLLNFMYCCVQFYIYILCSQSLVDIIKREQGHFDAECILFIDLKSRNLNDANCLSICRNIIILNLNNNNLTNVRNFGVFTQLKILLLAQNQIHSLDGLQSCENLETLNIAGNNLTGLKSLSPLLQLTQLRSLCLNDRQNNLTNPLCNSTSYQKDVKNNLPNLDILDNEWIGQSFQEHLSSLESMIEQLENPDKNLKENSTEKSSTIIMNATNSNQSIRSANEEYEQLLQSIRMLVK
ncbi:unnamed protein product [Adineta steineri]|uniref:G-protein coupled receptors family 1 profile domain-containing protein n=1 Tax=Adineta steineri TaxID=433720 RepID=A0A818Y059_9BILA|nr:unnamed protein product [Adineta steineri]